MLRCQWLGSIFWRIYAHVTKCHMLRILAFMESYSVSLDKAALLVKLVYVPACEVEGEYCLSSKCEVTFIM